ncbi:MAG: FHA domain-containing protein [Nostoc sp. ChiSLP01]|nr:FHA domain-containing protein [Nostoc sp. CmiSLP01]MDZ8286185.1 FHA domain-containing protein [Nostoc sp. ChiSLP01]
MNALTLQWHDAGRDNTQNIYEQQPSKNPGTVRIGRDPLRCDIVLSNPTVSGLHIEIFFHPQQQRFYVRNLRSQNPPLVDGRQLVQGEMPLAEGTSISLGQIQLKVTSVSTDNIPATILMPPQPPVVNPHSPVNIGHGHHHHSPTPPTPPPGVYALKCPKCQKVSPPENLQIGCPWCGTSLAAAVSVLVAPGS